jgi:uncharacterized membrane protein YcaP (DUF421 family)
MTEEDKDPMTNEEPQPSTTLVNPTIVSQHHHQSVKQMQKKKKELKSELIQIEKQVFFSNQSFCPVL